MANYARNVMLAETWDEKKVDPKGWWISEKLDGVRAYWTGSTFYSRNGNTFEAPQWFKDKLPSGTHLDGELWCGRGLFQKCVGIAKKKLRAHDDDPTTSDWRFVSYCVFDAPQVKGDFETRYNFLKSIIKGAHSPVCVLVGVEKCVGVPDLKMKIDEVESVGGEGLMLRKPHSAYVQGRCDLLLKVKTFHDEEAKIIGYQYKEGSDTVIRHIRCILPNGIDFSIGTGFSDAERRNPPKIGAVITFKYQSLSDEGKPRFPAYLRERRDITWKDVLNNAKTKNLHSNQDKIKDDLKEHGDKAKRAGLLFTKSYSSSLLLHDAPASMFKSPVKPVVAKPAALIIDQEEVVVEQALPSFKKKPVCKYGPSCYRKNADHLEQFSHPWAEEAAPAPASAPAVPKAVPKAVPPKAVPVPAPAHAPVPMVIDDASPPLHYEDPADQTYMPPQPKKSKKQQLEEASRPKRPSCAFGASCYRKNPQHWKDEAHPGDPDFYDPNAGPTTRSAGGPSSSSSSSSFATPVAAPAAAPAPAAKKAAVLVVDSEADEAGEVEESNNSDNRPVCRYGSSCYRTNPDHLKNFRHFWESKPAANKSSKAAPVAKAAPIAQEEVEEEIIDDTASLEALEDDFMAPQIIDDEDSSIVLSTTQKHKVAHAQVPQAQAKKRPNAIVAEEDDEDDLLAVPAAKRPKFE